LNWNSTLEKGPVDIKHYQDWNLSWTNVKLCQLECLGFSIGFFF
jgi:hypothetical protein